MRAVLDACVLYPPVLRGLLLGADCAGLFQAQWSDRILEEWLRATRKLGAQAEAEARLDAALIARAHPRAHLPAASHIEARLVLPDENDRHVLAVAIAGSADAIITLNAADFPRGVLATEGLARRDPDGFLWELHSHNPQAMGEVVARVHAKACDLAGADVSLKSLLKRAGCPRLAKAVLA
ncbi:MAG: PIN domain-containing protein [Cypionkella sp.]|nr:PIN domain-containing protein [Cypionkella sp.]